MKDLLLKASYLKSAEFRGNLPIELHRDKNSKGTKNTARTAIGVLQLALL